MKDLRIIFMGTPDFAVATLDALIEANKNIVAVVTAPDRPAGRGRKLNISAVKKYALSKSIPILQPTNLKHPDFLKELESFQADLQIVVAFRMLPKLVWSMPAYGTFNLHASLLPDYRGAAPINWAVINGDQETGVSTFFINENIDTGDIIKQKSVKINQETTAGILHDELMSIGSELVLETVDMIEKNSIKLIPQKDGDFRPAPKLTKDNCRIDWTNKGKSILNHIRGLNPYPGAWTILKNDSIDTELKVYAAEFIEEPHDHPIGHLLISKKKIAVAINDGFINITDLKLAGKRRMNTTSLLNGFKFHEDAKMF